MVDEAYIEFASEQRSVTDLVRRFDNLFVARLFSKAWGRAWLRLCYVASADAAAAGAE
jgi:histidinol-phosphate/aromatic aminotransferase/cobyric acid decarboxylase-like protein